VDSDASRAVILLAALGGIAETLGKGILRASSSDALRPPILWPAGC
jgi:hypothetical protein